MRKMLGESMGEQGSINVVEHIMLKNMWEYYIIEDSEDVNPEGYATDHFSHCVLSCGSLSQYSTSMLKPNDSASMPLW